MKYEEGVRWLTRVRTIDLQIKEKMYQIEALYTCIGLQGVSYDKVSVITSKDNKFERIISDIAVLREEVEELNLRKAYVIKEISARINKLGECPEKTILFGFYVGGLDMEKIATDLGYELSWCYRLRRKGIEKL